MKLKILFGLALSFFALSMTGCGGGGGGGAAGTTVSGTVAKGPVKGATVKVFEIISSHNPAKARVGTTVLGQGTTLADGSFAVNIGGSVTKGGLLVEATDGTYTDEATGALNTALSSPINAAFGNISGMVRRGQKVIVNVTPFTEMGFQAIDVAINRPSDANIAAANGKVASILSLTGVNIITTNPIAADAAPPAAATAAQIAYSQALATVSQMIAGGKTLAQVEAQFVSDIKAGALSPANRDAGEVALLNFLNSAFNKTGPAEGLTVTVAPNKTTVAKLPLPDKAIISATVKRNNVNVPDGTKVNFIIKSGGGASLSAASAITAGGMASVDLTGTIDSSAAVVTASAGGISADSPTVNFVEQLTQAIVTVSLTGTLPSTPRADGSFRRIGNAQLDIGYATNKGLGIPVSSSIGIGVPANVLLPNPAINPVLTGALWADTISPDVAPTVGTVPGPVQTLTFAIAPGNVPTVDDFTVAATSAVRDDKDISLAGIISVTISVEIK